MPNTETSSCPKKLLIFGIDAASWKVLNPLLESGYCPTLNQLINSGTRADLQTLNPTVSVMLWTTIATGCLPEKHGIRSWLMEGADTSGQLAITSNLRKVPAFWNLTDKKRVLIANWWASWPAEHINGVMISNRAHYPGIQNAIYPFDKIDTVKSVPFRTKQDIESELTELNPKKNSLKLSDFLFNQIQRDYFYMDAAMSVMKGDEFDIVAVFVRGVDILEHDYLHDVLPYDNAPQLKNTETGIVTAYYRLLDEKIAEFIDLMGPETAVCVLSDHGMDPMISKPPIIEGLRLDELLEFVCSDDHDSNTSKLSEIFKDNKRYPPGLVRGISCTKTSFNSTELNDYLEKLIGCLQRVMVNGKPMFDTIQKTENFEECLILSMEPETDIKALVTYNNKQTPLLSLVDFIVHPRSGQHWNAPPGIFLLSGPGINHYNTIKEIDIQDTMPTLLALMDFNVSESIDGRPRSDFITNDCWSEHPVKWVESYPTLPSSGRQMTENPDIDKQIKSELKSLGYIQ
ncbi:alkaline phosphatase family protein [bacterium]|nr:alkaline phosphatase family protein [candidate division CSSED10-310 bacterium]